MSYYMNLQDAIALDGVPQSAQPVPVDAFDQVAGQNVAPNAAEDDVRFIQINSFNNSSFIIFQQSI